MHEIKDNTKRLVKILDALSQLLNVAVMPNNSETTANESLSGRAYRQNLRIQPLIDKLFFWEQEHCKSSYLSDVERAKQTLGIHDK